VLVIAFCDHELSDPIPKTTREPALIKSNEFVDGPERFGVAGVTQKQTKE
jgi:hypothetical protein